MIEQFLEFPKEDEGEDVACGDGDAGDNETNEDANAKKCCTKSGKMKETKM